MNTANTDPAVTTMESGSRSASSGIMAISERGQSLDHHSSEPALPLLDRQSDPRDRGNRGQPTSAAVPDVGGTAIPSGSRAPDIEQEASGFDVRQTASVRGHVWPYFKSIFSRNRHLAESTQRKEDAKAAQIEYDKCKRKHLSEYPAGVSRLAEFQSSDDDLAMSRGFHQLRTRILLHLQVELTGLEKELFAQDHQVVLEGEGHRLINIVHNGNDDDRQHGLFVKILTKLRVYDELLLHFAKIRTLDRATERNHRSLFYWIYGNTPLSPECAEFIYHADDFVSVVGGEPNHFEILTQDYLHAFPKSWFMRCFTSQEDIEKNTNPNVGYFSKSRTTRFADLLWVFVAVGILLVPVFLLFLVPMTRGMMALVASVFLLFFAVVMTFMAKAKVHEVFVGTATYGAVLIVFLGNLMRSAT